jgi:enterochelin esterase-like enzyme
MYAGSQEQKEVKEGEVIKRSFTQSAIYPGTTRDYWVYIPRDYTPDKPACLYVGMDGIPYNAPAVLDSLIAAKEVPVMIGVFVSSGTVFDTNGDVIRFNRSNEFDKTDDTFARFILEELLPDVEKQRASDGRPVRLSKNPDDRMLSGNSSGAICAFTLAWQRPDMFRRVFSAIGTYVPMRGGNEYPALIRKTEPKPLRIFLQDGTEDTWNPLFGSWYEANVLMESALRFAGYDIAHEWVYRYAIRTGVYALFLHCLRAA